MSGRRSAAILAFAAMAIGGVSTVASLEDPEVERVLERARRAIGYDALRAFDGSFRVSGRVEFEGASGRYDLRFSGDGLFVKRVSDGEDSETRFDGERLWRTEDGGPARPIDLEDRDAEFWKVFLLTGLWLAPESPFVVALDRDASSADAIALRLRTRDGPFAAGVVLDRATHRLLSAERVSLGAPHRLTFADHRMAGGVVLPFVSTYSHPESTTTLRVESIERADALSAPDLAPPSGPPRDTSFLAGVPPEVLFRFAETGHLLVRPRIDGLNVGEFLLDSGAERFMIDAAVAERLGHAELRATTAVHATGRAPARFRRGSSFELGPLRVARPAFAAIDLRELSETLGVEIAGVCGSDVFARAVVEIDAAVERIRIRDPRTYVPPPSGAWRPLRFQGGRPCVECEFTAGVRGRYLFQFDTGYSGFVLFHSPVVRAFGLPAGRTGSGMRLRGVAGESPAVRSAIDAFEIGGRLFRGFECGFFLEESGAHADPYLAGTVGSSLLDEFRIVLDYPHARIGFFPPSPSVDGGR